MEQRVGILEKEWKDFRERELPALRDAVEGLRDESSNEREQSRRERVLILHQVEEMRKEITGLIREQNTKERVELRRDLQAKSGQIAKLEAEIKQRTLSQALKQFDPAISFILKIGAIVAGALIVIKAYLKAGN